MKIKIKNTMSEHRAIKLPKPKVYSADKLSQSYLGDPYEWEYHVPAVKGWWIDSHIAIQHKYADIRRLPEVVVTNPMDTLEKMCRRAKDAIISYRRATQPVKFAGHMNGWAFYCTEDKKRLFAAPSDVAAWVRRRISGNVDVRHMLSFGTRDALCFFVKDELVAVIVATEVNVWDARWFELKNKNVRL